MATPSRRVQRLESPLTDAGGAAEYLGMSYSHFMHTARWELPYLRRGKRIMFHKHDLDLWIARNTTAPAAS